MILRKQLLYLIVLLALTGIVFGKYSGGTGEPNDPYLIATPNDLNSIGLDSNDWDKHFLMTADINMAGITGDSFNIIGYKTPWSDPNTKPFSGIFDGANHVISNFSYEGNTIRYTALFGFINGPTAEIKNLTLLRPRVKSVHDLYPPPVGALAGAIEQGCISRCHIIDVNVEGMSQIGGIAGPSGARITECEVTGVIKGYYAVGGIVGTNGGEITKSDANVYIECYADGGAIAGENFWGKINDCNSIGVICGTGYELGGFTGRNGHGMISNCSADVNVTGGNYVGGFVGSNYYAEISNCIARGNVFGNIGVGGFFGENIWESTIEKCFFEGSVAGSIDVGGFGGSGSATTINSYCKAKVEGDQDIGGFIGYSLTNTQSLSNCFCSSTVSGNVLVGAFLGRAYVGSSSGCFWDKTVAGDVNGLGDADDPGLIGLPTAQMQQRSTFADAGWDMVNIWDIGENQIYPFLRKHLPSDIDKDGETNFYDFAILAENWLSQQ